MQELRVIIQMIGPGSENMWSLQRKWGNEADNVEGGAEQEAFKKRKCQVSGQTSSVRYHLCSDNLA